MATLMEDMLDAFMESHASSWAQHTAACYQAVFEQLYLKFPDVPGDAQAVIKWVAELEPAKKTEPLKTRTRRDYYDRIKYFYRWSKAEVPGAQDLPELPYESFASRRARGNGRG